MRCLPATNDCSISSPFRYDGFGLRKVLQRHNISVQLG